IGRRLGLVVAIFVAIVACLLALNHAQVEVLSGVRAYVGGESLWSKGQKDAVQFLQRYVERRNPRDYDRYLKAIAIPLGDRRARLELERAHPDMDPVAAGFAAGRNHPSDVPEMARFYRHFSHVSYMATAVDIWKLGDRYVAKLQRQGDVLHEEVTAGHRDTRRMRRALTRAQ